MKNLKPIILGSFAGAGLMFVALQYHVIQSHDGLQLVPRAPRASLGLAYADVREWKAEQWSDRPELARALVAHGASDLIADSVRRDIADSLDADGGTIGELRSLLNEPLFGADGESDSSATNDDALTIPFDRDARKIDWDEPFADHSHEDSFRAEIADRSRDSFFEPEEFDSFERLDHATTSTGPVRSNTGSSNGSSEFTEGALGDPFSQPDSSFRSQDPPLPSTESAAERRRRQTSALKEMLFSDEVDFSDGFESTSTDNSSGYNSITRALDSRASQALDRARLEFGSSIETARRENSISDSLLNQGARTLENNDSLPPAIRALRDGFDPFLK
jgi:hypothetical protein